MVKIRGTIKLKLCPTCKLDGKAVNNCQVHMPSFPNSRKTVRKTVKPNLDKPTLIVVGESMVDVNDVAAIKKIRSKTDLYVVVLKSQPNMEYPLWANGEEIAKLVEHFNIVD
jgi:CO dehydrogenase/acetyl-CoA synthase epsilon subunit